jgi:hypothetical protein
MIFSANSSWIFLCSIAISMLNPNPALIWL